MIFRASASSRWINCPGSVPLSEGVPEKTSIYAAEGTVAHALAEDCLRLELDPGVFLGEKRSQDGFDFEICPEMVEGVRLYLDETRDLSGFEGLVPEIYFERKIEGLFFDFGTLSGTVDCLAIAVGTERLVVGIFDLKYGAGVSVDVEDNKQLLTYSVLVSELLFAATGRPVDRVDFKIVQPRARDGETVKKASFEPQRVYLHKLQIEQAGARALEARTKLGSPELLDYLAPGDWCRFCPVKATCPKLHEEALSEAKVDFGSLPLLEAPSKLSIERLLWWLDNAKTFEDWLEAIRDHAKDRALAGEGLPGWKLVDSIAHRRWAVSAEDVERSLRSYGFKKKDLFETRLVTPAEAERAAPSDLKKKDAKSIVDSLTVRPKIGVSLVRDNDKRSPFEQSKPEDDFQPLGN